LSRLLIHSPEVTPIVWRQVTAPAANPVAKPLPEPVGQAPVELDDAQRLSARDIEFDIALEQKGRQSWEIGFRAGEEAAKQKLEGEVRATTEQLSATIAEVAGTRAATIRRAEADIVRLSIEVARRVLHRELSIDTSALEALIKAALEKLQSQEIYRVRVHPDQEKIVRTCLLQMGRGQGIEVINDPVQPRGGAVFELSSGSLDASVDTQLREIERGLIDHLKSRP
jgi:flagellar assembly protein FliH